MKLKFDPSLDYQHDAISAVVDIFDGQPIAQSTFEISGTSGQVGMKLENQSVGNNLILSDEALLANIHKVQERNGIPKVAATFDELPNVDEAENIGSALFYGRNFSVEMETGTGKTYVYLRTIFELNKNYGFKKFIIVVPSVPIREGVLKSIEMTRDHFKTLYNNIPFDPFVYDSSKLGKVRQFAGGNQLQIMIVNIQSFQRDDNIMRRESDKMSGRAPIEFIKDTSPIVIIDEPQSVEGEASRAALAQLSASFTLRYSATHRNPHNLLYKLDPVKAYDLRLVKRIEVASIRSDDSFNDSYVQLIGTDNSKGIKAKIEIHKENDAGGIKPAKMSIKQGDDLFVKSGERDAYKDGFIVRNIDCTPGEEYIEFNNGKFLKLGQSMGGLGDEILKAQVFETVEQHFKKERVYKSKGIKVLSLFFVDQVKNYRIYHDDGTTGLGKIGRWFEEAYKQFSERPIYKGVIPFEASQVHNGYFSQDKNGKAKDTRGDTKDDEDTYSLIMRDKERLLDPVEPLRFIFSHTALREGWDNPNVFQICTLREVGSEMERRQQIGRGLRLPVNDKGDRVFDDNINRLTVIASETYEDFASSLQTEYERDFGIKFGRIEKIAFAKILRANEKGEDKIIGQGESAKIWNTLVTAGYINAAGEIQATFNPKDTKFKLSIPDEYADLTAAIVDEMKRYMFKNRIANAKDRKPVKFNKEVHLSEEFKELWDKIKQRTRYRVSFDTAKLVVKAVTRIQAIDKITPVKISIKKVDIRVSEAGVEADKELDARTQELAPVNVLPDILAFLQKETELTRHTLVEILKKSGRLSDFKINPQHFMTVVAREISRALHDLMLEGIKYQKVSQFWEMSLFEPQNDNELMRYLVNLYPVQNQNKSLYDAIEYESEVERQFAQDLDSNENVKLFVKLPRWFKIDTPIGTYNPDWAFITEREDKLYFVRETKSTLDDEERRTKENHKIKCGKKHFDTLDVDFDVVTKLSEVKI